MIWFVFTQENSKWTPSKPKCVTTDRLKMFSMLIGQMWALVFFHKRHSMPAHSLILSFSLCLSVMTKSLPDIFFLSWLLLLHSFFFLVYKLLLLQLFINHVHGLTMSMSLRHCSAHIYYKSNNFNWLLVNACLYIGDVTCNYCSIKSYTLFLVEVITVADILLYIITIFLFKKTKQNWMETGTVSRAPNDQ